MIIKTGAQRLTIMSNYHHIKSFAGPEVEFLRVSKQHLVDESIMNTSCILSFIYTSPIISELRNGVNTKHIRINDGEGCSITHSLCQFIQSFPVTDIFMICYISYLDKPFHYSSICQGHDTPYYRNRALKLRYILANIIRFTKMCHQAQYLLRISYISFRAAFTSFIV